jgi:chitodextrinase
VLDLRATDVTATSAKLAWTAPGGDGAKGRAARYEVRRSKARITSATWRAAEVVSGVPIPGDAGKAESFTVAGLAGLSTYYFALRAVDESNNWSGLSNNALAITLDDVPPSAVADLLAVADKTKSGTLLVTFTAPGDNGALGQAKGYELRYASTPLDAASFAAAKEVPTGAPQVGGSKESVTLAGLASEARYYLALRTTDAAGNVSALSNVAEGWTRDEAPAAVTDLALSDARGAEPGAGRVTVSFTAPGDDGTRGTATRYDLRYADTALTASNFAQARAAAVPAPQAAGTLQQAVITGLPLGKTVYVGLVTYDERNNASPLSNVPNVLIPDQAPPAAIADLVARTGNGTGRIDLAFTATGDDGTSGTAQSLELRWALAPIDTASWETAKVIAAPAPAAAGTPQTFTASGLPDEALVHLALRAKDEAGNWSPVSNSAAARTADVPPAAITTLRQTGKTGSTVTLTFTAPGDDGSAGTATAYDLRTSADPLTEATFALARAVPVGAPQAAGKQETVSIGGLSPNQRLYVAVKALDDRGGWGTLSNVVLAETIDDQAPGAVADLRAQTGTASGTITLAWTATGDDGADGTAKSYDLRRATAPITEASFAAATPVPTQAPKAAGGAEAVTASALDGETVFHFAVRVIDEAGNVGPLSNVAQARTPAVAPAAVTDLSATSTGPDLTISWTAPGDDGQKGTATLYDLRLARSTIGDTTFTMATAVPGVPPPAVAGTRQSVTLSGLTESTDYYFALKTKDDTDTWSGLSNVLKVTTSDRTAPGAPTGLQVTTPSTADAEVPVVAAEATSSLGLAWMPPNLFDGRPDTAWASAGSTGAVESFTADLGKVSRIDRVKLLPDGVYKKLFPRDFVIEVSTDKAAWRAVASEEELVMGESAWLTWGFPATDARYVRVTAAEANASFGKRYAIVAEIEVWAAAPTDGRALLGWVNPGDDGATGTAKSLEVYRHTAPFSEATLAAATKVAGAPTPNVAGSLAQMNVAGLLGETTYHWAVRAVDEAGNAGPLSAVVAATTNAVVPAPIADLSGAAAGQTSVSLTWTAPGDDAQVGRATSYELRRATGPLTSQTFALATVVTGVPSPADAGTKQSFTVTGLSAGAVHRFAIVARDEAGNASYLSNVATVATEPGPDTKGPDAVTDLDVRLPAPSNTTLAARSDDASSEQLPGFAAASLVDGSRDSAWASAGRDSADQQEWVRLDLGSLQDTDHVRLWPSPTAPELFPRALVVRTSPDGLAFTDAASRSGVSATAGVPIDVSFASARVRFVEVRATELARSGAGLFYAVVAEAEVLTPNEPAGTLFASFTAPGDDGPSRRAASYDLRIGACPHDHASATAFATGTPGEAGSPERFRLASVPTGRRCVGLVSHDAAGNASALSNVVELDVR